MEVHVPIIPVLSKGSKDHQTVKVNLKYIARVVKATWESKQANKRAKVLYVHGGEGEDVDMTPNSLQQSHRCHVHTRTLVDRATLGSIGREHAFSLSAGRGVNLVTGLDEHKRSCRALHIVKPNRTLDVFTVYSHLSGHQVTPPSSST